MGEGAARGQPSGRWRRSREQGVGVHDLATEELDYPLDESLVATEPARPRDSARMMVFHRSECRVEHRLVRDLVEYLPVGATMVFNETRVAPLRFVAKRLSDGRETEGLFITPTREGWWKIFLHGARRFRDGDRLELISARGEVALGDVIEVRREPAGGWEGRFVTGGGERESLERSGRTPLPPYIIKARQALGGEGGSDERDRVDYQTVFARVAEQGRSLPSCAAPTAGLHFTAELFAALERRGVRRTAIELQVGPGTFRPVEAVSLLGHQMHQEICRLRAGAAMDLAAVDPDLSLVVGTTSVRCLESLGRPLPAVSMAAAAAAIAAGRSDEIVHEFATSLLISPGFEFAWTRRLLTNFHLPRSTLLALVGALVGLDQLKELYREAQSMRYRFYSLGDAMLILP